MKAPKFEENDFEPAFALTMMLKDLTLAEDAAKESELFLPALSAVKKLYNLARIRGFGDEDSSAVIKAFQFLTEVKR